MRLLPVTALIAFALALPVSAGAQDFASPPSAPQDFSAADQYVESVPTARGPKAPTIERSRDGRRADPVLPPQVAQTLQAQGGAEGRQLMEVATSPALGAPERKLERKPREQTPSVPAATVSALGDGDGDSLVWLLVVLAFVTGALVGLAARRRRGGSGIGGS